MAIIVENGASAAIRGNDYGVSAEMNAWVPRLLTIAVSVAGVSIVAGLVTGNLRLKSYAINAKRPVAVVPNTIPHESLLYNLGSIAKRALAIPKEPGFPQN